jgi:type IV secretory pathway component VirB8
MTVFLSVKMPGKVTSHKVKDNVVNITFEDYSEEKAYEIVSTSSNTLVLGILILLFFFLMIAAVVIVIIVLINRKKDVQVQDDSSSVAVEETDVKI